MTDEPTFSADQGSQPMPPELSICCRVPMELVIEVRQLVHEAQMSAMRAGKKPRSAASMAKFVETAIRAELDRRRAAAGKKKEARP